MVMKIYINPGHSDKDPGAVVYETERKLNVKTSNYMAEHLQANYVCEIKVTDGKINSTAQVAAEANKWGANLFVSNHNNAGGGDGYEALVHNEKRVPLGKVFEKHVKAAGQNSRGVKLRPNLAVLRLTNMPAVLNEGAFVDNKKDIADWNEDHELKKLGIAYAEAAAEYLELPKEAVETTPAPTDHAAADKLYRVYNDAGKQVGSYSKEDNAFKKAKELLKNGGSVKITVVELNLQMGRSASSDAK